MALPLLGAGILGGLVTVAGSLVGRVLIALSIGYVAYSGVQALLDTIKAQVISMLSGAPANIVIIMSLLKVDVATSILFSALAARLVLKGLTSDVIKRMVVK